MIPDSIPVFIRIVKTNFGLLGRSQKDLLIAVQYNQSKVVVISPLHYHFEVVHELTEVHEESVEYWLNYFICYFAGPPEYRHLGFFFKLGLS